MITTQPQHVLKLFLLYWFNISIRQSLTLLPEALRQIKPILLPIFLLFRDNGITVQIMIYQLYCEGFMFLLVLFIAIIPIENDVLISRIVGILFNFIVFVIQPLFYLNGDFNFRERVLQKGLLRALKKELFEKNIQIQPVC